MSLFNVLIHIREEAPFYSHAWSRKERVTEMLLTSVYASRYKLYQECNRLRQRLDATLRVYAELYVKVEGDRLV